MLMGEVLLYHHSTTIAHIRQSMPDPGMDFQAEFLKTFRVVAASLGSGNAKWGQPNLPPPAGRVRHFLFHGVPLAMFSLTGRSQLPLLRL